MHKGGSKKVFVLGAGSSIGHSRGKFPNIRDFFSTRYNLGFADMDEYFDLDFYTKTNYGKSILESDCELDIEDLFTCIEIEIERKSSIEHSALRYKLLEFITSVAFLR